MLLKKFGEIGLQIYKVITGKRTVQELKKDLEIDEDLFVSIVNYMEEAGMVSLDQVGKEPESTEKAAKQGEVEKPEEKEEPEEEIKIEPEEKEEDIEPLDIEEPEEKDEIEPLDIEKPEEKEEPEEEIKIEPEEKEEDIEPLDIEEPEEKEEPEEDLDITSSDDSNNEPDEEGEDLSPVERIIKEKYGEVGIKVYNLIDGQKTAEEIMKETGLTESKLVEILDFMDEQGIIKLEYPKGKKKIEEAGITKEEFVPITSEIDSEVKALDTSPVEIPSRAKIDLVGSMQLKAKLIMKNKAAKVFDMVDGKKDTIDIALKLDIPIYELKEMLDFLITERAVVIKPLSRSEVKKKYGDDGYNVYKKHGKEGLMFYQLIGRKDLTIKQMAEKVSKDKEKVVDMFMFVHKVLGIDIPLDRDVLHKQLE